jgi:hypothetical protein
MGRIWVVTIRGGDTATARTEFSPTLTGKSMPVLLTVRDSGTHNLTGDGGVLLRVAGSE